MTRLNDCYCDVFSYVLSLLADRAAPVGYEKARADILALLEAGDTRAVAAHFTPEDIQEAKFAVCAWVDETLLRSSWEGAVSWRTNQLQQFFFETHNAGVEFFDRLSGMQNREAPARETYALCLGLGFHGKYFVTGEEAQIGELRRQAARKVVGGLLTDFEAEDAHLFPAAYEPLQNKKKGFNPWAFDWWFLCIPVLTILIAVELYFYFRNDLNIELLGFFGSLG